MSLVGKKLVPETLAGDKLGKRVMQDDDGLVGTPIPPDPGNVILMEDNTGWLLLEDGTDILLE